TGEFLTSEGQADYIDKLLRNFNPSEVLVSKKNKQEFTSRFGNDFHSFFVEDWMYQEDFAMEILTRHFNTSSLKGFGIAHLADAIIASGAALHYLSETQHSELQHITAINRIAEEEYVWMDRFTIRNLELYHATEGGAVTLIDTVDQTI